MEGHQPEKKGGKEKRPKNLEQQEGWLYVRSGVGSGVVRT